MHRLRLIITSLLISALSILVYYFLFIQVHPLGGLKIKHDSDIIKKNALIYADELNIPNDTLLIEVNLNENGGLIKYLQQEYGADRTNDLLQNSIPGYYWRVEWKTKDPEITVTAGDAKKSRKVVHYISLDMDGNLLDFSIDRKDTSMQPVISYDSAKTIAESFLNKSNPNMDFLQDSSKGTNDYSFSLSLSSSEGFNFEEKKEKSSADYEFSWLGNSKQIKEKNRITINVKKGEVSAYKSEIVIPESSESTFDIIGGIIRIVFYIVAFIVIAVLTVKRIKAFEIGFRTAFVMSIIVAITTGIGIYISIGENSGWEILIAIILAPLFYGGGVLLFWAVSETITRETWKEKFISLDLLTKGYTFHSRIGTAFLKGMTGGFALAAVWLLLFFAASILVNLSFPSGEKSFFSYFNTPTPAFAWFLENIHSSIFLLAVFFLFIASSIRRRFSSVNLYLISCAAIWTLSRIPNMEPLYIGIIIQIIFAVILFYFYNKTDVLTTLIALITYFTFENSLVFLTSGSADLLSSSYFYLFLAILTTIAAVYSLYSKDRTNEFDSISPAFAKNITERQRLQRELEIARDVQMSFLPRQNPKFKGLDIASRCLPALEVGGDYYDFVNLSDKKLGIIIGDVSGKGTQAAFYMTLTKGFLKALSRNVDSPAEVLIKMNELFYENVERGTFISMVYGIFDFENRTFKLARAGHNPVIVKSTSPGKLEMLNPTGLALGLEKGVMFCRTIKEMEMSFSKEDIFVFYTDGFTEAMNKSKEEYGEDRLTSAVEVNNNKSSQEVLESIFEEVKSFMGKALQHDDMTMVVVKITA